MSKTPDLKVNRTPSELISDMRKPKLGPDTGWAKVGITAGYEASTPKGYFVGVGFTNSWINSPGATDVPASWYLSESGETRLRGKIKGGVENTVIFALPEEVRPEYAETFICSVDALGNIDLSGIKFRSWAEGDTET